MCPQYNNNTIKNKLIKTDVRESGEEEMEKESMDNSSEHKQLSYGVLLQRRAEESSSSLQKRIERAIFQH
jgi:Skp family chaperone for outer membrane proteins